MPILRLSSSSACRHAHLPLSDERSYLKTEPIINNISSDLRLLYNERVANGKEPATN